MSITTSPFRPSEPSEPSKPSQPNPAGFSASHQDNVTKRESTLLRLGGLVVGVMIMLAIARSISGAQSLTSGETFARSLRLAIPIGLTALGAIFAERSGVVNIGLEGMLVLGTWFTAWGTIRHGLAVGIFLGILGGALGGLLHAIATVSFGVNQIVSGVAINILAGGAVRYLNTLAFNQASQSDNVNARVAKISIPLLSTLFRKMHEKGWFLVSDFGGLGEGLTTQLSLLTVASIALVPLSAFVLWKTVFGLRLRSAGENPAAGETLGVNIYLMKYLGVIISGAFAGLGGAFLVLEQSGLYREGQVAGRGFIGIAAMIFGNWQPAFAAGGAVLFGFSQGLALGSDKVTHSLLLVLALALSMLTIYVIVPRAGRARTLVTPVLFALGAAGFFSWYFTSDRVPNPFVDMTPYAVTLLVLAVARQKLRPPATEGIPYRRGG
jgi:general nucleoside transport system permease protein